MDWLFEGFQDTRESFQILEGIPVAYLLTVPNGAHNFCIQGLKLVHQIFQHARVKEANPRSLKSAFAERTTGLRKESQYRSVQLYQSRFQALECPLGGVLRFLGLVAVQI